MANSAAITPKPAAARDFLSIRDFTPEHIQRLIDLARHIKAHPLDYASALKGKTLAMIFDLDQFAVAGLSRHAEDRGVINPGVSGNDAIRFAGFEQDSWQ